LKAEKESHGVVRVLVEWEIVRAVMGLCELVGGYMGYLWRD
jgi:hypothetical protein